MARTMADRLEAFFQPCVTVVWRGHLGKLRARYYGKTNDDDKKLCWLDCLRHVGQGFTIEQYDKVAQELATFGYSLLAVGGPGLEEPNETLAAHCR